MGGFYPAPNPSLQIHPQGSMNYGGIGSTQNQPYVPPTDPVHKCYEGMRALPDGCKTEKVLGRWYIVAEPQHWLLTRLGVPPKYRVYTLGYDLLFHTNPEGPVLNKGQAMQMAMAMWDLEFRVNNLYPHVHPNAAKQAA